MLHVLGKGDYERESWVFGRAEKFLEEWIKVRGKAHGPLFYAFNNLSEIPKNPERANTYAIDWMMKRVLKSAGIEEVTPHDFRRTAATHALEAGIDALLVARQGGWKDIRTLVTYYDRRTMKELKIALDDSDFG